MSFPKCISLNLKGSFQLPTRSHAALCVMAYSSQGIYTDLESLETWDLEGNCSRRLSASQTEVGICAREKKCIWGAIKLMMGFIFSTLGHLNVILLI